MSFRDGARCILQFFVGRNAAASVEVLASKEKVCFRTGPQFGELAGHLIDGGTNGGILGDDTCALKFVEHAHVDLPCPAFSRENGRHIWTHMPMCIHQGGVTDFWSCRTCHS